MVSDPIAERRQLLAAQFGVAVTTINQQLVSESRRLVLAVKPQSFAALAAELTGAIQPVHLLISIMAGVSTPRIESAFPSIPARVVRVMPNLPLRVGAGMAGLCAGRHATPQDVADVRAIFEAGGGTLVLRDESLMDAVTAISGSGPAYFYSFVEALVAGGVACGLSEQEALSLATHTCLGAARMMIETNVPPAELRRQVTSKGGTTQAALEHMERAGVHAAIRDAVKAAFQRGRELGT